MSTRIEQIQSLLESSPDDVFLQYSLGKELTSQERYDEALEAFAACDRIDESYLPAKVEAAKTLRAAGRLGEARNAFALAYEAAGMVGERHVQDFVRQQLESLPDDTA